MKIKIEEGLFDGTEPEEDRIFSGFKSNRWIHQTNAVIFGYRYSGFLFSKEIELTPEEEQRFRDFTGITEDEEDWLRNLNVYVVYKSNYNPSDPVFSGKFIAFGVKTRGAKDDFLIKEEDAGAGNYTENLNNDSRARETLMSDPFNFILNYR